MENLKKTKSQYSWINLMLFLDGLEEEVWTPDAIWMEEGLVIELHYKPGPEKADERIWIRYKEIPEIEFDCTLKTLLKQAYKVTYNDQIFDLCS